MTLEDALKQYRAVRVAERAAKDVLNANTAADRACRNSCQINGNSVVDSAVQPVFRAFYDGSSKLSYACVQAAVAVQAAKAQVFDAAGSDVVAVGQAVEGIAAIDVEFAG